jgi:hypothetical protein
MMTIYTQSWRTTTELEALRPTLRLSHTILCIHLVAPPEP